MSIRLARSSSTPSSSRFRPRSCCRCSGCFASASPTSSPPTRSRRRSAASSFENYVEVFTAYDFTRWFSNSLIVALGATAISLPAATMMAYAAARYRTGGSPLLVSVLASQMLPPIVLVLPLFLLFTTALPVGGHVGDRLRARGGQPALHGLDAGQLLRGREPVAGGGGAHRRRDALAGVYADHPADRGARHPRRGAARLRAELERVPLRADPERLSRARRCRSAWRASRRMPASTSRRSPPPRFWRSRRCSCCCRSCTNI